MILAKAVFTIIDDVEGEKTTTVIEYGPFDTSDMHVVQALIAFLNRDKDDAEDADT